MNSAKHSIQPTVELPSERPTAQIHTLPSAAEIRQALEKRVQELYQQSWTPIIELQKQAKAQCACIILEDESTADEMLRTAQQLFERDGYSFERFDGHRELNSAQVSMTGFIVSWPDALREEE